MDQIDLDPFDFIIDVLVLLLLDIALDIDLYCIYSHLICVLCFVLPRLCVAGFRSIDLCLVLTVYGGWWYERSDEARSIGCLSREPATCGRRYRSTVRSYFVFIVAVDSVVALCECVYSNNGPFAV